MDCGDKADMLLGYIDPVMLFDGLHSKSAISSRIRGWVSLTDLVDGHSWPTLVAQKRLRLRRSPSSGAQLCGIHYCSENGIEPCLCARLQCQWPLNFWW